MSNSQQFILDVNKRLKAAIIANDKKEILSIYEEVEKQDINWTCVSEANAEDFDWNVEAANEIIYS